MRLFIAGIDGYLGFTLAQYWDDEVGGCDNYSRRKNVQEVGGDSVIPIGEHLEHLRDIKPYYFQEGDLRDYGFVRKCFREFQPEAIVHFGEQPSAPYSMIDVEHAVYTQSNNVVGTLNILYAMKEVCPEAHLVKLGTMGEYGTPDVDIPEGFFELEFRGRKDTVLFPRQAGSWYHQTKIFDSHNVQFACKIWGLRSTDIMQGVVYGTRAGVGREEIPTRFDADPVFGTALNRFCAQAVIGLPLTPYGKGEQKRGFLPLKDSMRCIYLALTNPPEKGEYRIFNQFDEVYSINELALIVQKVGREFNLDVTIKNIDNPRVEAETHYYNPDHEKLFNLGYTPTGDIEGQIWVIMHDLMKYKDRIKIDMPTVNWRQ